MEALRTQIDSLQWEINRLDAENRKLREANEGAVALVDLETELEESKREVESLKESLRAAEERLANATVIQATSAEEATQVQLTAVQEKLGAANTELQAIQGELQRTHEQLRASTDLLNSEREKVEELQTSFQYHQSHSGELEEEVKTLTEELKTVRAEMDRDRHALELERYRAVETVREKWETREQRVLDELDKVREELQRCKNEPRSVNESELARQLSDTQQQLTAANEQIEVLKRENERGMKEGRRARSDLLHKENGIGLTPARVPSTLPTTSLDVHSPAFQPGLLFPPQTQTPFSFLSSSVSDGKTSVSSTIATTTPLTSPSTVRPSMSSVRTRVDPTSLLTSPPSVSTMGFTGTTLPTSTPMMTATMPAAQPVPLAMTYPASSASLLPQITHFSGDQKDGETFEDWLEHLESVGTLAGWNDHYKLVHLTSALRGTAKSFYRSCAPVQRSNYQELVTALKKRFKPVVLTAVQSQLFHSRRQGQKESVDDFAQDLRKLHAKAYATSTSANLEAEKVGQIVLVNQFISGLRPELQRKLVGLEGSMDEMLLKARFEEVKIRDLHYQLKPNKFPNQPPANQHSNRDRSSDKDTDGSKKLKPGVKCYTCGAEGHLMRQCPSRNKGGPSEALVKRHKVSNLSGKEEAAAQETVAELKRKLREAELRESLDSSTTTIPCITTTPNSLLGPTLTAEVKLEGRTVKALLDTGSPVTIASLEYLLDTWKNQRPTNQTLAEWRKAVEVKLEEPTITLQHYGGGPLNTVCQVKVHMERAGHAVDAVVQVHKGAPTDLLLGTDLLPVLGFQLLESQENGASWDLFSNGNKEQEENTFPIKVSSDGVKDDGVAVSLPSVSPIEVCLLKATRLPALHKKLVKAQVQSYESESPSLFVPTTEALKSAGLRIEEAVLCPDENNCVTLIVENHGLSPAHLFEGKVLGQLEPVCLAEDVGGESQPQGMVGAMTELSSVEQRKQRLLDVLQLDREYLSTDEYQQLLIFLTDHHEQFALDPLELGSTNQVIHSIDTGDHPPIKQHPRRIPFALRSKVDTMVEEMLDQGVIKHSHSPWASPIVLVQKKDGSHRFCVDYRRLNSITKLDVYPLPRIDDTLDLLAHTRYFSTLDLASGYWQVAMDPKSQEKTAFTTHAGLYEFRKMPFGLTNAPATFQRLMEAVLSGLSRNICLDYIDDILVIGRSFEEHMNHLSKVFDRLKEAGLKLKAQKCKFGAGEVIYLGYQVTQNGLAPTPDKIRAVRDYPTPTDVRTLRSFIGLASYYRRFVPCFAAIASPLHALTKKDVSFEWSPACELAFTQLKSLLCSPPVLAFPDFTNGFILETDASGVGLGSVLAQKQEDGTTRPIAYASRSLQSHERNYGVTELEALALVWSVKHFRHYLYGHHCDVYTDHEALKALLQTPHPSGKLARWGLAIQELDLNIVYRSGKSNSNADALSRAPVAQDEDTPADSELAVVAALTPQSSSKSGEQSLESRQRDDPGLKMIIDYCLNGDLPMDDKKARELVLQRDQFEVVDGILYHLEKDKSLRIVPPSVDQEKLFHEVHDSVFGAHMRDKKVHGELAKHYWWPKMRSDIVKWSRGCLICASRRVGNPARPPLSPIPVAGPFDRVGVDVVQFPKSRSGNKYAVVFVDYLTKWPEVFPTADQTALTIAQLFVTKIISRHGVPGELLSDRGAAFLSHLMQNVCELMDTKKVNTTAYHPQTDGLVERFNRTLIEMLSKKVEKSGRDWDEHLPYVLFAYRASLQESTQESPFFLLYGRDPLLPSELCLNAPQEQQLWELDDYAREMTEQMTEAWKLAQESIGRAQKKQKRYYDQRSKKVLYSVGERVFVFMPSAKSTKAYKFARPFYGPYRVIAVHDAGLEVRPVDRPHAPVIRVALNRVRRCPDEIGDTYWPHAGGRQNKKSPPKKVQEESTDPALESSDERDQDTEMKDQDTEMRDQDCEPDIVDEEVTEPVPKSTDPVISKPVSQSVWRGRLRSSKT